MLKHNSENLPMTTNGDYREPNLEERLIREKQDLERRLAKVDSALTALQSDPKLLEIINIVSEVIRY